MEVDQFLKDRGVELEYTAEDLQRDLDTLARLGA
jgi:predicted HTH domain antitoxin